MSTATAPPGMAEAMTKFRANAIWAQEHYDLLEAHLNRFVAIEGGRILDVADNEEALREKFSGRREVFITYVFPDGLT